ncbi:MAG: ATP-binding protein [Flavobacteriales bacterium]
MSNPKITLPHKATNDSKAEINTNMEEISLDQYKFTPKNADQYSRSLIEASLDPLITINLKGKITDMNEALATITGKTRAELLNSDFENYFTDPAKARRVYEEVFTHGFVKNYPLTIIDGEDTDVLFNGSLYKDEHGIVMGAVVVARIITEQKRFEKELTEARVFAELATDFAEEAKIKAEVAVITAEDALKAKQQFLSNMSHEIRTPMNAIIGFTKVLLKTELNEKQKEYLEAIKTSGDTLIVLINDILDLAKVDAGKMVFEKTPFRILTTLNSSIHLFESKIQEKNLQLIINFDESIPEIIVGDPIRLHQILINLISNAVKFTSEGSISITVSKKIETPNHITLQFTIVDTGIGIPQNKIATIFENFQQAFSSTSRMYGGTGLGLAIVKQLIESQQGTISVSSTEEGGSTFGFTLNFQKTNALLISEEEDAMLEISKKDIRVLIVEDMALNQLLIKTLLDDFGFTYDNAENGLVAIEKLKSSEFDVILMDLQMPVMNGFEATDYIRNTLQSTIPIIALTADVTTVDLAKCLAAGMDDYLAKPVDERTLHNKIIRHIKQQIITPQQKGPEQTSTSAERPRYTDLTYLSGRTKSNPALMMEMIRLYLEQTPQLVSAMKTGLENKDWATLDSAVHKMIPSFLIMGIHPTIEILAKNIQNYANEQQHPMDIEAMVRELEEVCSQACIELEMEFNSIKKTN